MRRGCRRIDADGLQSPLDGALVALERINAAHTRWLVELEHLRATAPGWDASRDLASRKLLGQELERARAEVLADLAEPGR